MAAILDFGPMSSRTVPSSRQSGRHSLSRRSTSAIVSPYWQFLGKREARFLLADSCCFQNSEKGSIPFRAISCFTLRRR